MEVGTCFMKDMLDDAALKVRKAFPKNVAFDHLPRLAVLGLLLRRYPDTLLLVSPVAKSFQSHLVEYQDGLAVCRTHTSFSRTAQPNAALS